MPQAFTGLGQDGYLRLMKEVNFNTAVMTTPVDIPVEEGVTHDAYSQRIENSAVIASRIPQVPCTGRSIVTCSMPLKAYPTLMGAIMNLFLGTSSNATTETGVYMHTWLLPVSGYKVGKSATIEIAEGVDLADQLAGCTLTDIEISGDNTGSVMVTANFIGASNTAGVARATTWTYPAICPFNFGHFALTLNNGGAITSLVNSFNLKIDLGLDKEFYKLGSAAINQPQFKTIPKVELTVNVDADSQFKTDARAYTNYDITLSLTHTTLAGATAFYKMEFEIPQAKIDPATKPSGNKDRLTEDLVFMVEGGTTTGSGSVRVPAEVRVQDTTAAYA